MIQHLLIAFVCIVAIAGLALAGWSIHRTHTDIAARNSKLATRVDDALQCGTAIVSRRRAHTAWGKGRLSNGLW